MWNLFLGKHLYLFEHFPAFSKKIKKLTAENVFSLLIMSLIIRKLRAIKKKYKSKRLEGTLWLYFEKKIWPFSVRKIIFECF